MKPEDQVETSPGEVAEATVTETPREYSALEILELFTLALFNGASNGNTVLSKAHAIMEEQFHRGVLHGKKLAYDQGYRCGFRDAQEMGWAPPRISS
jgi:hypothetical protein